MRTCLHVQLFFSVPFSSLLKDAQILIQFQNQQYSRIAENTIIQIYSTNILVYSPIISLVKRYFVSIVTLVIQHGSIFFETM